MISNGTLLLRFSALIVFLTLTASSFATLPYKDISDSALPPGVTDRRSMDVEMADFDQDGDLDIIVAMEFSKNLLLINQGDGTFSDGSDHLPGPVHDSEDIAISDFDGDGDLDAIIVSEDDRIDLYYLNDGTGKFSTAPLPPAEITNGVASGDIDGDGDTDIITGNAGSNFAWLNDQGNFAIKTGAIPSKDWVSQDVQLGDLDGDGDLDLVEANEGKNRVLLNDGQGKFTVVEKAFGGITPRESRQAALGDVDGDGDLDVAFGNGSLGYYRRQAEAGNDIGFANRLFLNDGNASFTLSHGLPDEELQSVHIDLIDLDHDGDLDILTPHVESFREPGQGRVRAYLNDGSGGFTDQTAAIFPDSFRGNGWDTAVGDVNGDGKPDIYLANRWGEDRLLIGN